MEDRWKGLPSHRRQDYLTPGSGKHDPEREGHVFYRDMRFWLILLMLAAFFAFTLIQFP